MLKLTRSHLVNRILISVATPEKLSGCARTSQGRGYSTQAFMKMADGSVEKPRPEARERR